MDAYETLSKIGDGTFGTVYLCRKLDTRGTHSSHKNTNNSDRKDEFVAIKKMKKKYHDWNDCIKLREVNALRKLNHKNVILLKEVIRSDNNLYLVFEYLEENLHQLINKQSVPFPESVIRNIVVQIASGLGYIHENGFFHRDIKPENLLCHNQAETVKIADFGLTREINSRPPYTDYVSTLWYRAPELLLRSNNYTSAVDIWALGCVASELYMLRPIFPGRSEIDQIFKICQILGTPNIETWPEGRRLASLVEFNFPSIIHLELENLITNCSIEGLDLIKTLLNWNPNGRPGAKEVLGYSFLKG